MFTSPCSNAAHYSNSTDSVVLLLASLLYDSLRRLLLQCFNSIVCCMTPYLHGLVCVGEQLIQVFLLFGRQQISIVQSTKFHSEFQQPMFVFKPDMFKPNEFTIPIIAWSILSWFWYACGVNFFELVVLIVRWGNIL